MSIARESEVTAWTRLSGQFEGCLPHPLRELLSRMGIAPDSTVDGPMCHRKLPTASFEIQQEFG